MFSSNTTQVSNNAVFVEDVFSTWLYTGNGSTQTINNGIDLAGKGGLVWVKNRGTTALHTLSDTARGANFTLHSSLTDPESFAGGINMSFLSSGWSVSNNFDTFNQTSNNYVSWTFREQPKFFDVVTYTGNGSASQTVNHNLGSAPGCMFVKAFSTTGNWFVYHTSLGNTGDIFLNSTAAARTGVVTWNSSTPTSTQFQITSAAGLNTNGVTYVAYLFAHNAGGFGLSGTDNVISCGSYTGNGNANGPTVNLGYEPQFLIIKAASSAQDWWMFDNMRGMPVGSADAFLKPNTSGAEGSLELLSPNATGFQITNTFGDFNANGQTYIYIAIRRGPMRTPTTGTSVFAPVAYTGNGAPLTATPGVNIGGSFVSDSILFGRRTSTTDGFYWESRLPNNTLFTAQTWAEGSTPYGASFNSFQNGVKIGGSDTNASGVPFVHYAFGRAPGFFDVVCNGSGADAQMLLNHNLGVAPEMIIKKLRNGTANWNTWASGIPFGNILDGPNTTGASYTNGSLGNSTPPSATQFQTYQQTGLNYVYYLFASCPGVSKVGSYTGNGSSQTIDCGFTGGARFVMVKRTNSTGNWLVVDTARGLVSADDPTLYLNSTAVEVTGADWIDPASSGFIVNQEGTMNANVNGGSYIYLAIA